jgi:uncharacterized protein (DUF1330 family)
MLAGEATLADEVRTARKFGGTSPQDREMVRRRTAMSHLQPDRASLEALAQLPDDASVVMLNMLRFRAQAEYPVGSGHAPCSGREAYRRYGEQAVRHVQALGGSAIWMGGVQATLIGPSEERWDEVLLVQYPSRKAFLQMISDPEYLSATVHRTAALSDSRLIAMRAQAGRT